MKFKPELSVNQKIELPFKSSVSLYIKREDLIHPIISGNKYRQILDSKYKKADLSKVV